MTGLARTTIRWRPHPEQRAKPRLNAGSRSIIATAAWTIFGVVRRASAKHTEQNPFPGFAASNAVAWSSSAPDRLDDGGMPLLSRRAEFITPRLTGYEGRVYLGSATLAPHRAMRTTTYKGFVILTDARKKGAAWTLTLEVTTTAGDAVVSPVDFGSSVVFNTEDLAHRAGVLLARYWIDGGEGELRPSATA